MFYKTIADPKDYQLQKAALLYFQGPQMVKLLDYNDAKQTLILEYISDHSLKEYFPKEDKAAIHITCELIKNLHHTPHQTNFNFPHLEEWCACLNQNYSIHQDLLNQAKILAQELLITTKQKVLLHGDLHHDNILLRDKQAIAIDPKPVWGDPLFEPARFILNPIDCILEQPNVKEILHNRIILFSQYFNDKQGRIKEWTFVCAMIAACWNVEDGFPADSWITLAQSVKELL